MDVKREKRGLNVPGKRQRDGKTWLDAENEIKRTGDWNVECGSGDPVQSLLVCVWGGAAVKSMKARGWG